MIVMIFLFSCRSHVVFCMNEKVQSIDWLEECLILCKLSFTNTEETQMMLRLLQFKTGVPLK